MEQGKLVEKLYFLNSGIVRLAREHRGMDFTLGMISSQEFISTPLYLTNGVPSSCSLETLTEVEVLEWGKQEVDFIMKELHHGQEVFWSLMERVMTWVQDNQVDALCLSAEERYQKLMDEQPEVIRDVPVKYIASFLNIHQDSLSRIRKQTRQKS
ncbi:cyclic nucleotide-binding domain-containing protein [Chitinophaga horti]|uniref:Cyclic nucleotide-binding domain-containing protein n=1 Tax=Chitinophaga horti TaxID=2920382 RepID=A0ABY6J5G2_9BACT|nr:cyclic nucleotide-binding domain-containing protein [Chitinophaga horti]UYQ94924.1 cyclic nucleotide-binding domain-containing protein [Chitinophaga horti]